MITVRTPLRISFVWGWSDLPAFYRTHGGAVLSTSIDKCVYINVNQKFDGKIRLSYSKTEIVDSIEELEHDRAKEVMKYIELPGWVEMVSIADIPSQGTWLGSSSSFTVGLLHALSAYKQKYVSKEELAAAACHIEIDALAQPIGKQDQYAAAYGGLNLIEFLPDDTVRVEKIICLKETKEKLEENLLMMYTGITRSASNILETQSKNMISDAQKTQIMQKMVWYVYDLKKELENNNLSNFGKILHENWLLKKELAGGISNPQIDEWYDAAMAAGAEGGKILWAGGGGFLLFYAPKEKHQAIIDALPLLKHTPFSFDNEGSTVVYYS